MERWEGVFKLKPDFETTSKSELRSYVLAKRDDDEAFYKLLDRLNADNKDIVGCFLTLASDNKDIVNCLLALADKQE